VKEADIPARKGRRTIEKEGETKRELELGFDMPTDPQYNTPPQNCLTDFAQFRRIASFSPHPPYSPAFLTGK